MQTGGRALWARGCVDSKEWGETYCREWGLNEKKLEREKVQRVN